MPEIISPREYPEMAAQQLVVELIRANKLASSPECTAEIITKIYDMIEEYFTKKYS